jgi:two-component system, OmpR family, phosphate regulon sensor histidine kinase PhoR
MPAQKTSFSSSISGALMLLAILAIVAFQGYWLRKNYRDEVENLHLRTNTLFRDVVQESQIERLRLDTNVKIRMSSRTGEPGVSASFHTFRMSDSIVGKRRMGSVIYSLSNTFRNSRRDSLKGQIDSIRIVTPSRPAVVARDGFNIVQLLRGVDSLQDSITVKEITTKYASVLTAEKIDIPFEIIRGPAEALDEMDPQPPPFRIRMDNTNTVTVGFSHPYSFTLELQNTIPYVLKKLTSQILVSAFLVGLTIFSFVLMFRNLRRQRRLTRLKNDFISNITHELKTPIATVSVAIEALRNFNALHDPKRTEEYLDISASELQRLSLLVDKVLKLSMFEKQQIELNGEPFDLKELVEEVVASMRLQFEKYKAKVSIQAQGEDFMIEADRMHITSVVFNLLDNALKYSKAHPSIQVEITSLSNSIEMSVTDNGIGISAEYQKKIFDKFFRVPTGDTHNVKGYGLGLSYVAYILDRHKGIINVESQPGIGTRFTTKLPKPA